MTQRNKYNVSIYACYSHTIALDFIEYTTLKWHNDIT